MRARRAAECMTDITRRAFGDPEFERFDNEVNMSILDLGKTTRDQLFFDWDKENVIPVVATHIHPKTLSYLGRGYAFREMNDLLYFNRTVLPNMYPFLKAGLITGGCSGNLNYTLAHLLGYDEVYLAGYDYGSPDKGETRFDSKIDSFHGDSAPLGEGWIPSGVRGWSSTNVMLLYKASFYAIIEYLNLPIFRMRDTGILTEIPVKGEKFTLDRIKNWLTLSQSSRLIDPRGNAVKFILDENGAEKARSG